MIPPDEPHHAIDKFFVEARSNELRGLPAAIDHQVQQPIDFGIGKAKLAFVGLADPQIAGRSFAENRLRHAQMFGQGAKLRFVALSFEYIECNCLSFDCYLVILLSAFRRSKSVPRETD